MVSVTPTMMDEATFASRMEKDGWVLFPSILQPDFVATLNDDLARAYETCRSVQVKNGIAANTDGSVHHLIGLGDSFMKLIESAPLWPYIQQYFGGNFILNSLGGIINLPSGATYASRVHRDVRTFSPELPLMLNMLIMLDDFTEENGATYLLSGSHTADAKPDDAYFFAHASRAIGKAGDIVLFNSNLWHAAGANKTQNLRRGITPTFSRPFMKQQCDYPRVIGYEQGEKLSEEMRQVLGYNSRVPANLDEWYQPPEKRMYKPGQG